MKIKRMIFENFRCYKERQEIEFDLDGKITIIYGKSGSGKSTINQFINWMFYDKTPNNRAGKINNFVIYNMEKEKETTPGDTFNVYGEIDFIDDDVEYQLVKSLTFKKDLLISKKIGDTIFQLNYKKENGSWVPYNDDISLKINEFIPSALSKYFFFSGEENVIDDSSQDLKTAIYKLFGITKYSNAIKHIGTKSDRHSIYGRYAFEKLCAKPDSVKMSSTEYQTKVNFYKIRCDNLNKNIESLEKDIQKAKNRENILSDELANKKDPNTIESLIKANKNAKNAKLELIENYKANIGEILYKTAPYLFMKTLIEKTKVNLSKKSKNEVTYTGLHKSTLEDILKQKVCVCGHCIGDAEKEYITQIIASMPPYSNKYTLGQYSRTNDIRLKDSIETYQKFDQNIAKIISIKQDIHDIEEDTSKKLDELEKLNSGDTRDKISELKNLRNTTLPDLNEKLGSYKTEYKNAEAYYKKYSELFNAALNYENSKDDYNNKMSILDMTLDILETQKKKKITQAKETLVKSMDEVYKQISTRVSLTSHERLINDDFTLRSQYKAGGQEAIDVYSYIIGMIKAIKLITDNNEISEFPLMIDAPFSHTDEIQLKNIIDVIPQIVSQVAMFTFDVRISKYADMSKIGKVWVIESNDTQTVSQIKEGEL